MDQMQQAMKDLSKWDDRTSSMKTKQGVQNVSQAELFRSLPHEHFTEPSSKLHNLDGWNLWFDSPYNYIFPKLPT